MAIYESRGSRRSATGSPDIVLHAYKRTFHLNKNALLSRSAKISRILKDCQKQKHHQDLHLTDIPADAKTFEQVVDFCYGELVLSAGNVIPLACVASYLEMTEDHSPDNLLKTTRSFFHHKVLPEWKETIKAFRSCERVLSEAMDLGLIDSCLLSISTKAGSNPLLLGKPIEITSSEIGDLGVITRPSGKARRKLFEPDACSDEIFLGLPLQLFELAVSTVAGRGVPAEHIASCLFRYAKRNTEAAACLFDKSPDREVVEAIERLLPGKAGVLPCKCLLELLRQAIFLQASTDCRKGLERRVGKQLQEASADDLLIPRHGFANETQYDMECLLRILKHFYESCSGLPDSSGLVQAVETSGMVQVMELIKSILAKVSSDPHLKKETFISLAGMVGVTLNEMGRSTDDLYSTIDVFLSAHGHLNETEREEVCQVLDVEKMSAAACAHAVQNERLPLRIAVQVLFVGQLRLQETIERLPESEYGGSREEDEEKKEEEENGGEEEKVKEEMERMDSRVVELERECDRMKREIERGTGRKKQSLWKEMKRKLGCSTALYESNCHVKKIHPKNGQND
ncbi:hypothetical protein H6P81_008062 [Aristolochia fimbriata]|uniref:Phototropic-responsive NPH3 family protein n=1 Tax=Aristolochia fimbriata TaxID=158543 RepID=A0AAV7F2A5_ARIFI|nr:hypothetical protein H6P81_008062 [Aristolochia fimbriata]